MQRSSRDTDLQARKNLFQIESCRPQPVLANVLSPCTKVTSLFRLIASLVMAIMAWPLQAQEASEGSGNLQSKAIAILDARCVRCHGVARSESQLRLDRSDLVKKNGRAGNPILESADESELLRRVVSSDPSYRMPKDEDALPDNEIEVLKNWIRSGEGFPVFDASKLKASTKGLVKHKPSFWERNSSAVDKIQAFDKPMRVLYLPALIFFVMAFLSERRKRRLSELRFEQVELSAIDRILSRFHWKHYFLVGLGFVLIGVLLQAREKLVQLETQLLEVRSENDRLKLEASPLESKNSSKAIRPKHPPRLGGTYYRGNDERNPQLFNGGYYRTATFDVTLVDSQGNKIDWGDELPSDGLLIKLDVKRAPFASPQLFSNEAMQNCFLTTNTELENAEAAGTSRNDKIPHSSQAVLLTTVVPNEHWTASYRIVESNDKRNVFNGKLFLTPGTPPPHYGIEYAIKITDGKISEESEIWMGSIYNSGVVVLPNPDRIQLSEWFDFLPIPEITRENSKDPELIGIKPKE